MKKIYAGIDMGGTNTVIALVDTSGQILIKTSTSTRDFNDAEEFAKKIAEEVVKMQILINIRVLAIGVGAPNGNFYAGTIEYAPNLKWKGVIPLAYYIEKYSGIKTFLTNDANAAALGELYYGGAKNMKNFITITLGTGVGTGIIVNGNLVYGNDGFAGEAGHIILYPDGRKCACGRKGCFEAYCNAKGIITTYLELSKNNEDKLLNPKIIYEMALNGDKNAIKTYKTTGDVLGLAMANLISIFNPEAIFLFGGIMNCGDMLLKPALKSLDKNVLPLLKGKTKILKSSLPEADAAVLGAASLCF